MSNRGNGMTAHLVQPEEKQKLERLLLPQDQDVTRSPRADAKPPVDQATEGTRLPGEVMTKLAALHKPKDSMVPLNTRVYDWVSKGITKRMRELEDQGIAGVTVQSFINQTLITALGLAPPES